MSQTGGNAQNRETMTKYWNEHSGSLTVDAMMLDDNSVLLDAGDRAEVLAMLPDLTGKAVSEIGAGIGRYTTPLLEEKKVGSIHATDFVESYIEKNREVNGHHANATFARSDVTEEDFGVERYDHVFSNWLFMYLSDEETLDAFTRIFRSLKPGGTFFLRESCFQQSGSKKRSFNPTKYRSDLEYEALIKAAAERAGTGEQFHVDRREQNQTYIRVKNNPNQLMWLFSKRSAGAQKPALQSKL